MTTKRPTSFKIFIAVIAVTALVFLTATLFSYYQVDTKYAMVLALFMFIALAFTTVGIYTGFKYKSDESRAKTQNRIGLIGNLLIFLFTIGLMAFSASMTARTNHPDSSINITNLKDTIKQKKTISRYDSLKAAKKFLTNDTLHSYLANSPNNIEPPLKGKPFNTLDFNKVIAYEFEGSEEPYPSVLDRFGEFVPVVTKQNALTQDEVNELTKLLCSSSTYGETTAACFIPHLGIVFYSDNKQVAMVNVCLGCNYLISSISIPAEEAKKINAGTEYECPAMGFSHVGRKGFKKLCDKYGYFYRESSLFD